MIKKIFLFFLILVNNDILCSQKDHTPLLNCKKKAESILREIICKPSLSDQKTIMRKIINELINEKQDLDKEYKYSKYTNFPLKQAIEFDDEESVTLLIKNGANVNIKVNEANNTLLFTAIYNGNLTIIKLLIEAGININTRGYYGDTALVRAITTNYNSTVAIVNFLLDKGADPNIKNDEGDTALISAIEVCTFGSNRARIKQIIKALIFHGADLNFINTDGESLMKIAKKSS